MDGELTFPELSHGTRSVFAWVTQLMLGMAQHYQYGERWKQRRGVFIIDEIDAHLHPLLAATHHPYIAAAFPKRANFRQHPLADDGGGLEDRASASTQTGRDWAGGLV